MLIATTPPGTINARTNLVLNATATDPDGDPVYYRWDFSDGKPQPSQNSVTTRYTKGGTYTVSVSAHDGRGGIDAKKFTLNVVDPFVSWTQRSTGTPAEGKTLYGVVYGNGKFVAAGDGSTVVSSPDGLAWTRMAVPAGAVFFGIAHSGSRFVAAGIGATATPRGVATYSDDGITWTAATLPAGVGQINAIAYGAGRFVAVGETGRIYTSTDGAAFTEVTSPVANSLSAISYAENLFVATGGSGRAGLHLRHPAP